MIHITVHDPSTPGHELRYGPHDPYVSLQVQAETDHSMVALLFRTPEALRDLAKTATRAASELSAVIAAHDRVSA